MNNPSVKIKTRIGLTIETFLGLFLFTTLQQEILCRLFQMARSVASVHLTSEETSKECYRIVSQLASLVEGSIGPKGKSVMIAQKSPKVVLQFHNLIFECYRLKIIYLEFSLNIWISPL